MSTKPMADNDEYMMTKEELARELKGSLLVLTTSSPDKREIYRELFSGLAKDKDHYAGLDVYFTDSGALGIAPRKTPEKTGIYGKNLDEKLVQQMATLSDKEVQQNIRLKLMASGKQPFDPQKINVMGMTEDSGMELLFESKDIERKFIDVIVRELKPKLRDEDMWVIERLQETGFPGPNFKPLQERLDGGFDELMQLIYKAADEVKVKELRFTQTVNVSFVSPRLGKYYKMEPYKSMGRLLSREEYNERMMSTPRGKAVNINFVQVFDGQDHGNHHPADVMAEKGLHHVSSKELPMDYPRRNLAEDLQALIGKRRSTREERKRPVRVAFVNPQSMIEKRPLLRGDTFGINDLMTVSVPTRDALMHHPEIKPFNDADVIVLVPQPVKHEDNHLRSDPNLAMILSYIVTAETDPESMRVPLILDNRNRHADHALEVLSDATATGRFPVLKEPIIVANTDKELHDALESVKDMKQREPLITTPELGDLDLSGNNHKLEKVPNDGVFTVFVGGGHANNSKRDIEDAANFGYYCAQQGWRIITGGGSVEGSMGAVHTGFVQYHLDQFAKTTGNDVLRAQLEPFKRPDGKYDAEKLILEKPYLVDQMAKNDLVPRKMFYAYSLKPLLEMESPSGQHPPGVTYFESGNRTRRLSALLASGTKVFLRGGIGTDEEFEETVQQHVEARMRVTKGGKPANDNAFHDGTPDDGATMIIFNKDGHLDKLLAHYGLLGKDPVARTKRETYKIKIVTNQEELRAAGTETAKVWSDRVRRKDDAVAVVKA